MKHVTWPVVVVLVAILAALAVMFGLEPDPTMRQQMLGYFDRLVPFILGLAAGAGAGAAAGYAAGYLRAQAAAKADAQQAAALASAAEIRRPAEAESPRLDAVRRAAEVVRVAADESDRAADDARAAATALRIAAEEGRAVAELQRSLLVEIRRGAGGQDGPAWPARSGTPNISVQR